MDDAHAKAADMQQQITVAEKESGEKLQEYAQSKRQSAIESSIADAKKEISALQGQVQTKEKQAIDLVMSLLT